MNRSAADAHRGERLAWALGRMLLLASCAGCVSSQHPVTQPAPMFDPAVFFSGATDGNGRLKIAFQRPQQVVVAGRGRIDDDGTLILAQTIHNGAGPDKTRTWRLRRSDLGRWTGTLSDAAGPVVGEVRGNRFHLAFAMKGGLRAQQWLYLQADHRTVRNIMVMHKLRVAVARLDETITHRPD